MTASPRVGVGVVVRRDDEVLLVKRHGAHGSGTWSTPGGNLDFGEHPAETAVREAAEETSVRVDGVRFIGFTNDVFSEDEKHYVTLWYEGDYGGGDARAAAPDELTDVGWFRECALPQPLFPPLTRLLAGEVTR